MLKNNYPPPPAIAGYPPKDGTLNGNSPLMRGVDSNISWKMGCIGTFFHLLLYSLLTFASEQDLDELYFGTDETFEVMTWNIEWFPKNDQITVDYVTQIIQALDIDLLAIQEVDDIDMFDQMLNGLPEYTGYLESAWFAGLAYIYKTDVIEINDIYEIYTTSPYWSAFPRSPMVMDLNFMGENLFLINNHFKCCGDGIMDLDDSGDEETRRYIASNLLKEYIDTNLSNENVFSHKIQIHNHW